MKDKDILAFPSLAGGTQRGITKSSNHDQLNLLIWQHFLLQKWKDHLRCVFKSLTLRETVLGKALGYPEVTPIWSKKAIFTDACGLPNYIFTNPGKPFGASVAPCVRPNELSEPTLWNCHRLFVRKQLPCDCRWLKIWGTCTLIVILRNYKNPCIFNYMQWVISGDLFHMHLAF